MMAEELKPCAHCGSDAKHYHRPQDTWMSNTDWVCCENDACGIQTCLHETKGQAIAAWNTRPTPSASEDKVAVSDGLPQPLCQPVPDRIWLVDLGAGDIEWSEEMSPDGDDCEGVEYARAELIHSREQMAAEAITKARDTFRSYGDLHAAKPDQEKAARNYALADEMDAAIRSLTTEVGEVAA